MLHTLSGTKPIVNFDNLSVLDQIIIETGYEVLLGGRLV
jgi:hypothetical protein